jgi:endonuclease/exonuclease/phosphatase family metal-dependent hydrolase
VLTIVNYNMHCGMDGWGRPYDYVAAIESFGADVIVLEEAWTTFGEEGGATGGESQAEQVAARLGYQVVAFPYGEGRRIRPQEGAPDSWRARRFWARHNWALYLDGVRALPERVQTMDRWREAEPGSMNVAVLVRPDWPIEDSRVLPMGVLPADMVHRVALVADLTVEGQPLSVAGTHMAHMQFGAHRNWAELRRALRSGAREDALLAGDMNTWSPVVKFFLPEWRRTVRGPSWPTWRPHSQIDHILVRGSALRVVSGEVLPHAGSDHRPMLTRLEVR